MSFKLHQIYFQPDQRPLLDPDMTPYDNSKSETPDAYEFYVFRKEYLSRNIGSDDYTGFVSWKFRAKTGVSAKTFLQFCEDHPGYDAYFVNPFPIDICHGNVWRQGDLHHPGLSELSEKILRAVGYEIDLRNLPASLRTSSFCNYWVGNKKFWDAYMQFCLPVWNYIFSQLSEPERKGLLKKKDLRTGSTYFAFIFERLFTTFILTHPEMRVLGYTYSPTELSSKYSAPVAKLVLSVQDLEAKYPRETNPLLKDPALLSALQEYEMSQSEWRVRPMHLAALRWLWLRTPFRLALQRNPGVGKIYNRLRSITKN